ncbi:MAG TPA: hypothetical protein VEY70_21425 [Metabacillus sp.]|nr:hypothetical protein [Metabacillus sp.]
MKLTKIPFSSNIHINCFLHKPIYGDKIKHTLQHTDKNKPDQGIYTQQFTTSTYYQDQPFCKLVHSNIHAITSLYRKAQTKLNQKKENESNNFTPLPKGHSSSIGTNNNIEHENNYTFPKAQLPIVLGEYETEIILKRSIPFKKGITNIIDISKELVLTNCQFLPTGFSEYSNKIKRYASKGTLFIEGYIEESIEYIPAINNELIPPRDWLKTICYQIDQKLIIELKLLLLQLQVVDSSSMSSKPFFNK